MVTARKTHLGRDVENRRARARAFVNEPHVVVETYANGQRLLRTGTILCVAVLDHGTTRDVLVLQEDPESYPVAISLAQVVRIYPRNAVEIDTEGA